jgi:hypothetical protein
MWPVGRRLVNSFEEEFSEDTLKKLKRKVASNMSQSVVALASFIRNWIPYKPMNFRYIFPISSINYVKSLLLYLVGKKRCFACTGVVIESNESITRVLTSASLVRTSDNENMVADNLKVNTLLIIV